MEDSFDEGLDVEVVEASDGVAEDDRGPAWRLAAMRRIFCSLELGSSPAVRAVIAAVQSMAAILGGGIGVDELAEVVAVQLGSVGDEHSDGGLCGVDASGAKRCGQGGGLR